MREIDRQYMEIIKKDIPAHYESGQKALDYIANSTAKYHGRCVRTLYMPKVFEQQDIQNFCTLVKTLYGIFAKAIEEYILNPQYRERFHFDKRLEELILLPPMYKTMLPVARIDIFYQEETKEFTFCEFNTDGTSAMNEDRELNIAMKDTKACQEFAHNRSIESFELFDSLVEELLAIYKGSIGAVERPHIAIVDFMDCATENEFQIIKESMERKGLSAEICEIRNLRFDGTHLYSESDRKIDMVYRRAVTCDIMRHFDEVQDFIQAVRHGAVCLLGDFRTQIVHNKIFYKIVQEEATQKLLTKEEREFVKAHFPYTQNLCSELVPIGKLLQDKDRWILKPEDSYGSRGVFAGIECNQEQWEMAVREHYDQDYIVQEFCVPYQSVNIDLMRSREARFRNYSNITGLYVYNGEFHGIYSRIAKGGVISTQYSEMALATMVVG